MLIGHNLSGAAHPCYQRYANFEAYRASFWPMSTLGERGWSAHISLPIISIKHLSFFTAGPVAANVATLLISHPSPRPALLLLSRYLVRAWSLPVEHPCATATVRS
jgi:hypothetical protein